MTCTDSNRRSFLKMFGLGGVAAAAVAGSGPLMRAFADTKASADEFFIFIHASGGWDVTVGLDPRNEDKGLVDPATTDTMNSALLKRWKDAPYDADTKTFTPVRPTGSKITFGPAIGDLADLYSRLTVINGLAMNTVSHRDGTVFSATGRHLAGARVQASSLDTILGGELGREQLFPVVSAQYPSSLVGTKIDRRATPILVDSVGSMGRSLVRSNIYDTPVERDAVTALLSREAQELAKQSHDPHAFTGLSQQYEGLRKMLAGDLKDLFSDVGLKTARPEFNYAGRFHAASAINLAFAVEAMKRNVLRCMSFSFRGFDTHGTNYMNQGALQQEMFDGIAALVRVLDATPHPTRTGHKLGEHTHLLLVSDFCRTPRINATMGRDHYPNNSALVISPRFKGNTVFGRSDPEQLLPIDAGTFSDGVRPIAPPDLLATFVSAFGVDPRAHMRDGEIVKELLA